MAPSSMAYLCNKNESQRHLDTLLTLLQLLFILNLFFFFINNFRFLKWLSTASHIHLYLLGLRLNSELKERKEIINKTPLK